MAPRALRDPSSGVGTGGPLALKRILHPLETPEAYLSFAESRHQVGMRHWASLVGENGLMLRQFAVTLRKNDDFFLLHHRTNLVIHRRVELYWYCGDGDCSFCLQGPIFILFSLGSTQLTQRSSSGDFTNASPSFRSNSSPGTHRFLTRSSPASLSTSLCPAPKIQLPHGRHHHEVSREK